MYREIEKAYDKFCERQIECETCPYRAGDATGCLIMFAYKKGYADAKREQDTRTDIQRFRVSGHP